MFAPILFNTDIKSSISGSKAAFLIIVLPSAKDAAIIIFSVAPTLTLANEISAPINRLFLTLALI